MAKKYAHARLNKTIADGIVATGKLVRERWANMASAAAKVFKTDEGLAEYVAEELPGYLENEYANYFGTKGSMQQEKSVSLKMVRCAHQLPWVYEEAAKHKTYSIDQLIRAATTEVQKLLKKGEQVTQPKVVNIVRAKAKASNRAPATPKSINDFLNSAIKSLNTAKDQFELSPNAIKKINAALTNVREVNEEWK